jgi:CRISPR-associated protein Cmr4
MTNYLTYMYLLTPLHTGGSSSEGNMIGIAREVHTEFPYLPASSLRGKIRSQLEYKHPEEAKIFFGHKIENGQQPTEGEVWFADATLLFFPIASLSHHLVWVTCPLWLERWNRWLAKAPLQPIIKKSRQILSEQESEQKSAVVSFDTEKLYLQTALLNKSDIQKIDVTVLSNLILPITSAGGIISQLTKKLVILTDEDCIALVETGLQREVRVALEDKSKTVKGGSFRSEEAIPPETLLFFPWGMKLPKDLDRTAKVRTSTPEILNEKLQFGGLEGLGRGWADLKTIVINKEDIE